MENIGNRLVEARKRLGIALREASEATKIRTDYLQAMENGSFDFSLPDIYKIGFLKIYAKYLKLDPAKFADDYATQFSGVGASSRENLGRLDAPGGGAAGQSLRDTGAGDYDSGRAQNQAAMIRLGVYFGGAALALVLFIAGIVYLFDHAGSTDNGKPAAASNPPGPAATAPATTTPQGTTPPAPVLNKYVFAANGTITNLQILQVDDNKSLYNGSLSKGQSFPVTYKGSLQVIVSQAQYLTIQANGGTPKGLSSNNQKLQGEVNFTCKAADWQ